MLSRIAYALLKVGSLGPMVPWPMAPNGSKGILWEGPRALLGSHGDPMGSNLGIPGYDKGSGAPAPSHRFFIDFLSPWVPGPPLGSQGGSHGIPRGSPGIPRGSPGIPRLDPIGSPWDPRGALGPSHRIPLDPLGGPWTPPGAHWGDPWDPWGPPWGPRGLGDVS